MYFGFSSDEEHLKILLGDELVAILKSVDGREIWRGDGTVIRYNVKEEEIGLELGARSCVDAPVHVAERVRNRVRVEIGVVRPVPSGVESVRGGRHFGFRLHLSQIVRPRRERKRHAPSRLKH